MVAVCYADGSHAKAIGVINSETLELTLIYETEIKKKGIRPGIYEHFKKGRYDVLGVITRKHVPFVVYKALYVDKHYGSHAVWMRPKKMFLEQVEDDKKNVPRFRYVGK